MSRRKNGRFSGKNAVGVGGSEGEMCPEAGSDRRAARKNNGKDFSLLRFLPGSE